MKTIAGVHKKGEFNLQDLIEDIKSKSGLYYLQKNELESIEKDTTNISPERFLKAFLEIYNQLRKSKRGNPFIAIPELEEEVCNFFLNENLTAYDFKNRLVDLKQKGNNDLKIVFSVPGAREAKGLKIDGRYYYYISIFR